MSKPFKRQRIQITPETRIQGISSGNPNVRLNVGGTEFCTTKDTLLVAGEGYLASLAHGLENECKEALFIDRDPELFRVILGLLRNGFRQLDRHLEHMDIPTLLRLRDEFDYYGLPLQRVGKPGLMRLGGDFHRDDGSDDDDDDSALLYNAWTHQWEHMEAPPDVIIGNLRRHFVTSAVCQLGDRVYCSGWRPWVPAPLLDEHLGLVLACGLPSKKWSPVASLQLPREHHGMCAFGGKLYVAGGYRPAVGGWTTACECYDPDTDAWTPLTPLLSSHSPLTLLPLRGCLYALQFGPGEDPDDDPYEMQVYDVAEGVWANLQLPADKLGLFPGGSACVVGNYICVTGGQDPSIDIEPNAVHCYCPTRDHWEVRPCMACGRANHAAVEWEGRLVVLGGHAIKLGLNLVDDDDIKEQAPNSALDAETQLWLPLAPLASDRRCFKVCKTTVQVDLFDKLLHQARDRGRAAPTHPRGLSPIT